MHLHWGLILSLLLSSFKKLLYVLYYQFVYLNLIFRFLIFLKKYMIFCCQTFLLFLLNRSFPDLFVNPGREQMCKYRDSVTSFFFLNLAGHMWEATVRTQDTTSHDVWTFEGFDLIVLHWHTTRLHRPS